MDVRPGVTLQEMGFKDHCPGSDHGPTSPEVLRSRSGPAAAQVPGRLTRSAYRVSCSQPSYLLQHMERSSSIPVSARITLDRACQNIPSHSFRIYLARAVHCTAPNRRLYVLIRSLRITHCEAQRQFSRGSPHNYLSVYLADLLLSHFHRQVELRCDEAAPHVITKHDMHTESIASWSSGC